MITNSPVKGQKLDESVLSSLFQDLTSFTPRQFQYETIRVILQAALDGSLTGSILRAPTGSGKTETAVSPFLFAKTLGIS